MPTCLYLVIESRGSWWVDCEGKAIGPIDTKEDAANHAVKAAELFGDATRRCEVMVPDNSGKYVLHWASDPASN